MDGCYVEPFAGGAGVGVHLLLGEFVRRVVLNDLNYHVFCFWKTVKEDCEYLCRRILQTRVTVENWRRQRRVLARAEEHPVSEVGFAFLFLNRTNRSGIVKGGVIGGTAQAGKWRIDARFYRDELVRRIRAISAYGHRIDVYCMDAEDFVARVLAKMNGKCFVYFDPPYFEAGNRLYLNGYSEKDHARLAGVIQEGMRHPWVATYDQHRVIRRLYRSRRQKRFRLKYSAARVGLGEEIMIFGDEVKIPRSAFVEVA